MCQLSYLTLSPRFFGDQDRARCSDPLGMAKPGHSASGSAHLGKFQGQQSSLQSIKRTVEFDPQLSTFRQDIVAILDL